MLITDSLNTNKHKLIDDINAFYIQLAILHLMVTLSAKIKQTASFVHATSSQLIRSVRRHPLLPCSDRYYRLLHHLYETAHEQILIIPLTTTNYYVLGIHLHTILDD
jgi:hypothetical protein